MPDLSQIKSILMTICPHFQDVLSLQDMGRAHSDRQMALRILCKFKSPGRSDSTHFSKLAFNAKFEFYFNAILF